jgi:hypothetical protein
MELGSSTQKLPTQSGERGVFIVLGALWMSAFLMLTALAIDTYMLATAKLQQGNTVEYMALAGLRALLDPASGATPPAQTGNDPLTYNFVIERAVTVAQSPLMGTSHSQVTATQLRVRAATGGDDEGEGCDSGGYGQGSGSESGVDKWCGFEGEAANPVGAVIFGRYDSTTGKFTPAAPGAVSSVNAVRVRLALQDPQNAPMVLPMMKLLIGNGSIMFQSFATAVRDSNGRYRLIVTS